MRAATPAGSSVCTSLQRGHEVLGLHVVLGRDQRGELVEAQLEVAVVVEAVDNHVRERPVALAHLRDHQLLAQVLAQRRLARLPPPDHSSWSRSPPPAGSEGSEGSTELFRRGGLPRRRHRLGVVVLEERIGGERLLHLLRELERRHLQQAQGLLDLRCKREVLP